MNRFLKSCILGGALICLASCSEVKKESMIEEEKKLAEIQLKIDSQKRFQTIESFGASGAWWSQDVGGWTQQEKNGLSKRDYIAELLFDSDKGIGLTSYRYNLGAGSADTLNSVKITDPWRRGESFEIAPKQYDWSKDANAQYMLNQAVSHGVNDIYFFVNSPLERLTKNRRAYGEDDGQFSNFEKDNYQEYFDYLFDVTEHFLAEGIPVKYLSPINEPQWEWVGGQEGSHFTPEEMVDLAKAIYKAKQKRPNLNEVALSVPELGEWANTSYDYYEAMINDEEFMKYYKAWDIHSYWSTAFQKEDAKAYFEKHDLEIQLKMSEWTEMVNGKDIGMDSALNLATQIYEDLTILDVIDWQYWIAVSSYDYRDGLIYVDTNTKEIEQTKRLWAMGNFSKFIRPKAQRIEVSVDHPQIKSVGFVNKDDSMYIILINDQLNDYQINLPDEFFAKTAFETSNNADLAIVFENEKKQNLLIPAQSVLTLEIVK